MTSIFLDDDLVADALHLTGAATEQEAVTIALREQLHLVRQAAAARELFGSLQWQGDLEQSRLGHVNGTE